MPSTISAGTTAGTAIAVAGDTTGNLAFQTNGTTTAMTIDTSQQVGIGSTTINNNKLLVKAAHVGGRSILALQTDQSATGSPVYVGFYNSSDTRIGLIGCDTATNMQITAIENVPMIFYTNNLERGRFDTSGNFLFNSGYGSVATAYGCRAWVNFNGTGTPAIRGSGNVSSITDNSQGDFTVNFTNAMPDAVYATVAACSTADSQVETVLNVNSQTSGAPVSPTTTATRMVISKSGVGRKDPEFVCVSIFR